MTVQRQVEDLVAEVGSGDPGRRLEASWVAAALLKRAFTRYPSKAAERRNLRSDLGPRYLRLRLSEDDVAALERALLSRLDDLPEIVGVAAYGLKFARRPSLAPLFVDLMIRYAPVDGWVCLQLVFALWDSLSDLSHRRPASSPTEAEWFDRGLRALQLVAETAVDGGSGVRDTARQALESLQHDH